MSDRLRRWIRRGLKALLIVAVLGALLVWATGRWIVPAAIGSLLRGRAAEVWDGAVTVEGVRFSWRGVVEVEEVWVEDNQGRPWLEARGVRIRLRNWPSPAAAPGDVDVDDLRVHLSPSPPLRGMKSGASASSPSIIIRRGTRS